MGTRWQPSTHPLKVGLSHPLKVGLSHPMTSVILNEVKNPTAILPTNHANPDSFAQPGRSSLPLSNP